MSGVADLGATTSGIWTRAQARAHLSVGEIDALVRDGTWQVLWPGVLADGGFVLTPDQRAWAAVLASGGAAPVKTTAKQAKTPLVAYACGRTAARLWELPLIDDDDPATGAHDIDDDDVGVFRNRGGDVVHAGRRLHRRQLKLAPGDLRRRSGLRATSPLRTLVDLASLLSSEALVCCLDDALHRGLVTTQELTTAAAARKGRRAGPALRAAVERADGRAEAPSETLLRLLLRPHFPGLEPQVTLVDEAARPIARFDLGDSAGKVGVEADGRQGHAASDMVAKDRRRDRGSRRQGWLTERVTWFDLRRRQGEVVDRVAETYAEQGRRPAA